MRTRDIVKFRTKMQAIRGAVEYADSVLGIALALDKNKSKAFTKANVDGALNALAYIEDEARRLSNSFRSE